MNSARVRDQDSAAFLKIPTSCQALISAPRALCASRWVQGSSSRVVSMPPAAQAIIS